MIKNIWRKAGVAAVAATIGTGGLIASTPSASAAPASPAYGNCYNYGLPGYGDIFSGYGYTGNCFEWQLNHYNDLPSYMIGQNKSLRSWGNGNPDWTFEVGNVSKYTYLRAGTWQSDMGQIDNLLSWVD
jgi:hypothetical protein